MTPRKPLTLDLNLVAFDYFPGEGQGPNLPPPLTVLDRDNDVTDLEWVKTVLTSENPVQQCSAMEILCHHITHDVNNSKLVSEVVQCIEEGILPFLRSDKSTETFKQKSMDVLIRITSHRTHTDWREGDNTHATQDAEMPSETVQQESSKQTQTQQESSRQTIKNDTYNQVAQASDCMNNIEYSNDGPNCFRLHPEIAKGLFAVCEVVISEEAKDQSKPQSIKMQHLDTLYDGAMYPILYSLSRNWIMTELYPRCLKSCQILCAPDERYHGIRLLQGLLVARLVGREEVVESFFDMGISACQDTEWLIRRSMCYQIVPLWHLLSDHTEIRERLIPELAELMTDEEANVQVAALESFLQLFKCFPIAQLKSVFLQLFLHMTESTFPLVASTATKGLGAMYVYLSGSNSIDPCPTGKLPAMLCKSKTDKSIVDTDAQTRAVMACYARCGAQTRDARTRKSVAFNFPGMLYSAGPSALVAGGALKKVFDTLVQDSSDEVRATLAAGLHAVAGVLGAEAFAREFREGFELLLQDQSILVRKALNKHLGTLVCTYVGCNEETSLSLLQKLIAFASDTEVINNDWRFQVEFTKHVCDFRDALEEKQVTSHLIPQLLHWMRHAVAPVQHAAVIATCSFARGMQQSSRRVKLLQSFVTTFQTSGSCHLRLVFVEILQVLLETYSALFVTNHFFQSAIDLLEDKVAVVRSASCKKILPQLFRAIVCVDDERMKSRLCRLLQEKLLTDKDSLVRQRAQEVLQQVANLGLQDILVNKVAELDSSDITKSDSSSTAVESNISGCNDSTIDTCSSFTSITQDNEREISAELSRMQTEEKVRRQFEENAWGGASGQDLWELRGVSHLAPHRADGGIVDLIPITITTSSAVSPVNHGKRTKCKEYTISSNRRNSASTTRPIEVYSNAHRKERIYSGTLPRLTNKTAKDRQVTPRKDKPLTPPKKRNK